MHGSLWSVLTLLAGCTLQVSPFDASSSTATGNPTGTDTTTGTTTTASGAPTTTTAGGTSTDDASTSAALTSADFLEIPDLGNGCDVFAQDCPEGQKCAWLSLEVGSMGCFPVVPDPRQDGEPCTFEPDQYGWLSGEDDCDKGLLCWPSGDANHGRCVALCQGGFDDPICAEGSICLGGRTHWHCARVCDPLVQDCPPGFRCGNELYWDVFTCDPDPGPPYAGPGQACDWEYRCEPSLTCLDASAVPGCTESGQCCSKYCPVDDPGFDCEVPGQTCLVVTGDESPDWSASVGLCALDPDAP